MDKSSGTLNFQIKLDTVLFCRLGRYWGKNILTGGFWRLYRNDSDGAGLIVEGKRYAMLKDKYYILSPWCELPTWCDDPEVGHLYLHFFMPFLGVNYPVFEVEPDAVLDALCEKLTGAMENDLQLSSLYAISLISAAVARLPKSAFEASELDFKMVKICEYMRDNMQEMIGIEDMAAKAVLPLTDFIRRFRAFSGTTPYRYLNNMRYERAEGFLRSGRYTIDEICYRVGINDRFHFSRCFKKRYGCSPARYRELCRENEKKS